ncbi:MAG: hypothetical protein CMJ48_12370 [Planctomycetaceae bacterium]|nr:hypothetical protein [Planctomycetaceae bacterium]
MPPASIRKLSIPEGLRLARNAHGGGRIDEADALCLSIVRLDETSAPAFHLLGLSALRNGHRQKAFDYLTHAVALDEDSSTYWIDLARVHRCDGDFDSAKRVLAEAYQRFPESVDVLIEQGDRAAIVKDLDAAIEFYEAAFARDPSRVRVAYNLGVQLADRGLQREAIDAFRHAVELRPEFADAHFNLALVLSELQQPIEAGEHYAEVLQLEPNNTQARFFRSLELLRAGDFDNGWHDYECRWTQQPDDRGALPYAPWDGSSVERRRVFVHSEQGVGDEIMFASCLGDLAEDAQHCLLECDARLVPLMRRSFPRVTVIDRPNGDGSNVRREFPSADCYVSLGSLPRHFRSRRDEFPHRLAYLRADEREVVEFRRRLDRLGAGLKVGISWRGGKRPGVRHRKSTELADWLPILRSPGVEFVNLQYGSCEDELQTLIQEHGVRLHRIADVDPLSALDRFASLISSLDLVLSVSNTTVHLAGALGVPAWMLLSYAGDWRWGLGTDLSPWYSTLRIFRQAAPGEWTNVYEEISGALKQIHAVSMPATADAMQHTRAKTG